MNEEKYIEEIERLLCERFGISINDTNVDFIERCRIGGETPDECVYSIGIKYDLVQFGGG